MLRRAFSPTERQYAALRPGEEWSSLPAGIRADRVAILNRVKDRGLGRVLAEPTRGALGGGAGVRRYGRPGPMARPATPGSAASDAEGSFEFLRACAQAGDTALDQDKAEGLVRSLYVARLFKRAVLTFEQNLPAAARAGDLAFETLRAYALSLVRAGRAAQADAFLSELSQKHPVDPDVTCCLAIVRVTTDAASARKLFAQALDQGQDRQLALNFLVALLLGEREPAAAIRSRLAARFRSHSRRAEAKGDTALLDALLSATEGDARAQLFHINRCLTFQGVARLALRDPASPLSPWNLIPAAKQAPASGPLVSVLVTTFNSAEFVQGSLRSLAEQTYRDIEIVVCDDASDDQTVAIVQRIADTDPRIKLVRNKRNVGTYASKNSAFLNSRGEYVTCHDSDDWAHPQKIEMQVDSILARPGRIGSRSLWVRVDDQCRPILANWGAFLHANPASLLLRREAFEEAGLFDSVRVAADSELLNRVRLVYGAETISTVRGCLSFGLDRVDSLTRGSAFGFSLDQRSAAREAYWAAWADWHIGADLNDLRLTFPPQGRRFPVAAELEASAHDIHANLQMEP